MDHDEDQFWPGDESLLGRTLKFWEGASDRMRQRRGVGGFGGPLLAMTVVLLLFVLILVALFML
jgi:hypothetical protein